MIIPNNLQLDSIEQELAYRDLYHFVRYMWRTVDPAIFKEGEHMQVICRVLMDVYQGKIRKLIINIPPRHCKSRIVSVMFPAWVWLHDPGRQFLFTSFVHERSIDDNVKCRNVMMSPLYQSLIKKYHPTFAMSRDENTKLKFSNILGGVRATTALNSATGAGGTILVCDDPNSVKESDSDIKRVTINRWFSETFRTRANDPDHSCFIVIQQRTNEDDLTGYLLSRSDSRWSILCLPARYECEDRIKNLDIKDWRTKQGEVLWPEHYHEEALASLEEDMGPYAIAGQLQQRPSPREGGMFKVANIDIIPLFNIKDAIKSVRYWDNAGTQDGGCFTAGVLIHRTKANRYVVADVVKGQWSEAIREKKKRQTAMMDGRGVEVWLEEEGGSAGKEQAQATIRNLAGFIVASERASGEKEVRARPFANQVEISNVDMVKSDWNQAYLHELEVFPAGKYKDQVDASSGAFNKIFEPVKSGGVWGTEYARREAR